MIPQEPVLVRNAERVTARPAYERPAALNWPANLFAPKDSCAPREWLLWVGSGRWRVPRKRTFARLFRPLSAWCSLQRLTRVPGIDDRSAQLMPTLIAALIAFCAIAVVGCQHFSSAPPISDGTVDLGDGALLSYSYTTGARAAGRSRELALAAWSRFCGHDAGYACDLKGDHNYVAIGWLSGDPGCNIIVDGWKYDVKNPRNRTREQADGFCDDRGSPLLWEWAFHEPGVIVLHERLHADRIDRAPIAIPEVSTSKAP